MRFVLPAILTAASLFLITAGAQETFKKDKDKDKEEKKETKSVYEVGGKTLDQWVKEIHSVDPSKREAAMRMVLLFGDKSTKALPAILSELNKHTPNSPIDLSVRVSGT